MNLSIYYPSYQTIRTDHIVPISETIISWYFSDHVLSDVSIELNEDFIDQFNDLTSQESKDLIEAIENEVGTQTS